jgi:integrase
MKWPPKLPKGFPLTVTDKGYVKTIAGRTRWIAGRVSPSAAMEAYHRRASQISARVKPMAISTPDRDGGSISVHYMINRYLHQRQRDVDAGELSAKSYTFLMSIGKEVDQVAGTLHTGDWTPDTTQSLFDQIRIRKSVPLARRYVAAFASMCTFAEDRQWCDPVRVGRAVLKKLSTGAKPKKSYQLYNAAEIGQIIDRAYKWAIDSGPTFRPGNVQLLTMIVLALNGGLGAAELSQLDRGSVNLDGAIIDQPRGKTGAEHVVPLWPESVALLRLVLAQRPGDNLVFRTRYGRPWIQQTPILKQGHIVGVNKIDSIGERFGELVEELGIARHGVGFYRFKHVHSTAADKAGDPHATFVLAGHKLPGARSHYVDVGVDRVRKVTEFIREHLGIKALASLEPASIDALAVPRASTPKGESDRPDDTACAPAAE